VEPLFVLLILGGLVRGVFYFMENEHFPQPFFYEPYDVWMDWFNTSYWAYQKGAYDAWATIYPPLSFVFLRIFSLGRCYGEANGYLIRECDWVGLATLFGFFFANIVLLYFTFRKIDRSTALWRALALGLGVPSVYALERGNLVVVTFTFLILGFGPLLKSARWRWMAVGMAINFKVYLIAGLFPQLLRRRWLWFEGALISTVAIYLITFGIMGDGSPLQIYENLTGVSTLYQASRLLDAWYATSYKPIISLLTGQYQIMAGFIGSRNVDLLLILVPGLQNAVLATVGVAAIAAWLRPEAIPMHRLTFLGLGFAMIATETGGYTSGYLFFFVFMEPWRGFGRIMAISLSYVLLLPFDIILEKLPPQVQESYLLGRVTFFTYYITLGPFIRPLLLFLVVLSLSWVTIYEVYRDIRSQGWNSRWRYRLDKPLLPRIAKPLPPVQKT
jgi:hypothetical protein